MKFETIESFHEAQTDIEKTVCDQLRIIIDRELSDAESKIWHAHPVWFLDGNPIVGYNKLKHCIRLLFFSGQSFQSPGLKPEGTFKAAEIRYTEPQQIDEPMLIKLLEESRRIQWDYKNIYKRKGELVRLI